MNDNIKIAILIGDGMADLPIDSLGGKTPLEAARTPNMDFIAQTGVTGLVKTVPDGMQPGSDIANLSIFGYDPAKCYTGRAPLEAINMKIALGKMDVAFRCNLVEIENGIMNDFSANHIETEFTRIIIEELKKEIKFNDIEFFPGVSYRNIVVWRNYRHKNIPDATPPHDIQGQPVNKFLPGGDGAEMLIKIMEESQRAISRSKIIRDIQSKYKGHANSVWLWGGGGKPSISSLYDMYKLKGHTISAVDLIHGMGLAAGLTPIHVEGATGYIDTNYIGKADALLNAMKEVNFVFLHVEAPDEAGHEGNLEHKLKAIEDFDEKIVGRVMEGLKDYSDFIILVMPDHPTPISMRTHSSAPVPFCIYSNKGKFKNKFPTVVNGFNEKSAESTGLFLAEGHKLLEKLITGIL